MGLKKEINQPGVQRVLNLLTENHVDYHIQAFDVPARQASEAAALLGCPLGAIIKSLVFVKKSSNALFLVLVSGANRADLESVGQIVDDKVVPAPPEFVLSKTGYPVGAVPPVGIDDLNPVIMDIDLTQFIQVWASGGAENILIGLSPQAIAVITHAQLEHIKVKKG